MSEREPDTFAAWRLAFLGIIAVASVFTAMASIGAVAVLLLLLRSL